MLISAQYGLVLIISTFVQDHSKCRIFHLSNVNHLLENMKAAPDWQSTSQKTPCNSNNDGLFLCKFWIGDQNSARTAYFNKNSEESSCIQHPGPLVSLARRLQNVKPKSRYAFS